MAAVHSDMKRYFPTLLFVMTLAVDLVRAQPAPAPNPAPPPLPSVSLPPDLDRVLRDYERAWRAKDAVALAKLFTAEGMALPNNQDIAKGASAIETLYSQSAGSPLFLRALAFGTSGELGYILGGYTDEAGKPDIGKFTLVLQRGKDGRWLIVSDMDNPNGRRAPAPPVPPATPRPPQKPT